MIMTIATEIHLFNSIKGINMRRNQTDCPACFQKDCDCTCATCTANREANRILSQMDLDRMVTIPRTEMNDGKSKSST